MRLNNELHIYADENKTQSIPMMAEVLDMLENSLSNGIMRNVELKNSFEGMEKRPWDSFGLICLWGSLRVIR